MSNLFETTPVYITIQDLRDSVSNEDLKDSNTVNDTNVGILIGEAQNIIDLVIQDYGIPNIENQETIFPIKNEDGSDNENIPLNIQKATALLVQNLYVGGYLDGMSYDSGYNGKVKSETSRGHTISFYNSSGSMVDTNQFLDEQVLMYIKPYYLNLGIKWLRT